MNPRFSRLINCFVGCCFKVMTMMVLGAQGAGATENALARIVVRTHLERHESLVSVGLEAIPAVDGDVLLYELTPKGRIPTLCQLERSFVPRLWWVLGGVTPAGAERTFELVQSDVQQKSPIMTARRNDESILLQRNGAPLLAYRHRIMPPPAGVDALFARSGYIHPLWSPNGAVLTAIQPPDHYHHYGIWNPWTKTRFQGREIDFWNLGGGQGTVRFAGVVSQIDGDVYAGFQVRQEHVDLTQNPEIVAMNELWDVRAWNLGEASKRRMWDLHTTLNCATDSSILLEAYRYGGGLGYRAVESWSKDNSTVLTSEGKTRADADGSRARWCRLEGDDGKGGRMGVLFMSHPSNRTHPEPMRVWPLDANNGRGDLFFEFCPIRHTEWRLEPGRDYALHYRMIVFNGEMSAEECEQAWRDFAGAVTIVVTRLER